MKYPHFFFFSLHAHFFIPTHRILFYLYYYYICISRFLVFHRRFFVVYRRHIGQQYCNCNKCRAKIVIDREKAKERRARKKLRNFCAFSPCFCVSTYFEPNNLWHKFCTLLLLSFLASARSNAAYIYTIFLHRFKLFLHFLLLLVQSIFTLPSYSLSLYLCSLCDIFVTALCVWCVCKCDVKSKKALNNKEKKKILK